MSPFDTPGRRCSIRWIQHRDTDYCKVGGVSSPLNRRLTHPVHLAAKVDFFICAFTGIQNHVARPVTMFSTSGFAYLATALASALIVLRV